MSLYTKLKKFIKGKKADKFEVFDEQKFDSDIKINSKENNNIDEDIKIYVPKKKSSVQESDTSVQEDVSDVSVKEYKDKNSGSDQKPKTGKGYREVEIMDGVYQLYDE